LYECLTGRPPFRGETAVDTMLSVTHDDPVPPRRLAPRLSRDLETIALKCLEKRPERRYASAEELADDVRAYLDGRPILARPASAPRRALRWVRRHPTATALAAAGAVAAAAVLAVSLSYNVRLNEAAESEKAAREAADVQRDAA